MVAALCTWHEHHEYAAAEINRRPRDHGIIDAPTASGSGRSIRAASDKVRRFVYLTGHPKW